MDTPEDLGETPVRRMGRQLATDPPSGLSEHSLTTKAKESGDVFLPAGWLDRLTRNIDDAVWYNSRYGLFTNFEGAHATWSLKQNRVVCVCPTYRVSANRATELLRLKAFHYRRPIFDQLQQWIGVYVTHQDHSLVTSDDFHTLEAVPSRLALRVPGGKDSYIFEFKSTRGMTVSAMQHSMDVDRFLAGSHQFRVADQFWDKFPEFSQQSEQDVIASILGDLKAVVVRMNAGRTEPAWALTFGPQNRLAVISSKRLRAIVTTDDSSAPALD